MPLPPAPPPSGGRKKPTASPDDAPGKSAKSRNPIERGIVWGLIALIAVVGALLVHEDRTARKDYETTINTIQAALREANAKNADLAATEVNGMIKGNPLRSESELRFVKTVRLEWKSRVRSYKAKFQYDNSGMVIDFSTGEAPEE